MEKFKEFLYNMKLNYQMTKEQKDFNYNFL